MRKKKLLLTMLVCVMWTLCAYAQVGSYNFNSAFQSVKDEFSGRDVDYYLRMDRSYDTWTFFVDAAPMQGWEHECYLVTFPKCEDNGMLLQLSKIAMRRPPSTGEFVKLEPKNRYGENANVKPVVKKPSNTNDVNPVAGRTYAVIVSGGCNKMYNYARYWNDCSFIYQTLRYTYGIPKEKYSLKQK